MIGSRPGSRGRRTDAVQLRARRGDAGHVEQRDERLVRDRLDLKLRRVRRVRDAGDRAEDRRDNRLAGDCAWG